METNQLADEDSIIGLIIVGIMEEYDLNDLYRIDDIEKSIIELKQLKKRFVDIHVKLKIVLGINEHARIYENYNHDVRKMADQVKEARRELSERKKNKRMKRQKHGERRGGESQRKERDK